MFILGHLGFSAAPAALATRWWGENRGFSGKVPDMRWFLVGALLPDLVDKAVGQVFFKPYFENGRIYLHTFLLAVMLLTVGFYNLKRRRNSDLLLLALGVVSHLVLDKVWVEPTTALWPSLGPFLRHPSLKSLWGQVMGYLSDPLFWVSETGGLALLVLAFRVLGVKSLHELREFILHGSSPELVTLEEGN
ncbi:MAG: metal-dependent hydrolase [Actinomycetota bacterium]|nr:metal-dependent hydrolase [Actinomycetota bacterium]